MTTRPPGSGASRDTSAGTLRERPAIVRSLPRDAQNRPGRGRRGAVRSYDLRVILRCTGTVLALLRTPKPSPLEVSAQDWYANLLWIERRKCPLLTHAATVFSVFVPDVRAAELRPPGPLVVARIHDALRAENLAATALGRLDAGPPATQRGSLKPRA